VTELAYDDKSPAAGSLNVKVQIATIDSQDKERNDLLVGADLFDATKFPTAQYAASSLARTAAGGLEAVGKLTIRGVTRDLRLPLKIVPTATGLELSGATAIKRLDYGVGQGDWKSTEGVSDEVKIQYKVALVKAK
jgi:polyisoprenoid-binding protein YceI